MALLDKFRKKEKAEEKKEKPEVEEAAAPVVLPARLPEPAAQAAGGQAGKDSYAYQIIKKPLITEKVTNLTGQNQYTFRVFPKANKVEIKKAIEKLYKVEVQNVRVLNMPAKKRQVGRFKGAKPGFKKAVVALKEGFIIEGISK